MGLQRIMVLSKFYSMSLRVIAEIAYLARKFFAPFAIEVLRMINIYCQCVKPLVMRHIYSVLKIDNIKY